MDIFKTKSKKQMAFLLEKVHSLEKHREEDIKQIEQFQNSNNLLKNEIQAYKKNQELQDGFFDDLQNLTITISQDAIGKTIKGAEKRFTDYKSATYEISKRYEKEACIGNIYTDPIINARVAFIVGDDIEKKVDESNNDKRINAKSAGWLNAFIEINNISNDGLKDDVAETEIEGRLLWTWKFDENKKWSYVDENDNVQQMVGMPIVNFIDWTDNSYRAVSNPDKKDEVKLIKFDKGNRVIKENDFVYRKFGGRKNRPDKPAQKMWAALDPITHVELCLFDLRRIDRLFASPTPELAFETANDADKAHKSAWVGNMKLGKLFIHNGKFGYVQIDGSHISTLIREWVINLQTVSMITGIPVHYFGLVELMSNRATAEDLYTQIQIGTSTERGKIESALNELVMKCAKFYNEQTKQTPIDESLISVQILEVDKSHWERLMKLFFPMAKDKLFSIKGLLELIPGIDAAKELEKLEMQLKENRTDELGLTTLEEKEIIEQSLTEKGLKKKEENEIEE